jgi:hypothetical protein
MRGTNIRGVEVTDLIQSSYHQVRATIVDQNGAVPLLPTDLYTEQPRPIRVWSGAHIGIQVVIVGKQFDGPALPGFFGDLVRRITLEVAAGVLMSCTVLAVLAF